MIGNEHNVPPDSMGGGPGCDHLIAVTGTTWQYGMLRGCYAGSWQLSCKTSAK